MNFRKCVNSGNERFISVLNSYYVDKSMLLDLLNSYIPTENRFICVSRPRRFGKSFACKMINAYYSKGCDSKDLFAKLEIAKTENYANFLNKFNVINLDMQAYARDVTDNTDFVDVITNTVVDELKDAFDNLFDKDKSYNIYEAVELVYKNTKNKFVVIIDEWDYIFRIMSHDKKLQNKYIDLLRNLFKDSYISDYIALAYMTGIMPIARYDTQSSLNNVIEYTMLSPGRFAPFFGFTEEEVKSICNVHNFDFEKTKCWYDGYVLGETEIYNPQAIISLILKEGQYGNFWSETSSTDALRLPLQQNFDGLRDKIISLLNGYERVRIDPSSYENNLQSLNCTDAILVYLIHLGYLGFNCETNTVYVPNEEIRRELYKAVNLNKWPEYLKEYQKSLEFLENVFLKNTDKVAKEIQRVHLERTSIIDYNNEASLKYTVLTAFGACIDKYQSPRLELPSGKGFADVVYIPKDEVKSDDIPALIIELKWNKDAKKALEQIKERDYVASVKEFANSAYLVGINYDEKSKEHSCEIEEVEF